MADNCRKHGISDATFYNWRSRYGGMEVSEARRLKALEDEPRAAVQQFGEDVVVLRQDGSISRAIGPDVCHDNAKRTDKFVPLEHDRLVVASVAATLHLPVRKLRGIRENMFAGGALVIL